MPGLIETITTSGNQQVNENMIYHSRQLLGRLIPKLVHNRFCVVGDLPMNSGTKLSKRRIERLVPNESPVKITEGISNQSINPTITLVEMSPDQYGDFIKVSDRYKMQSIDNIISEYTSLMSQLGQETFDTVIRNGVMTFTNIIYGGPALAETDIDDRCIMTKSLIERASAFLNGKDAMPIGVDGANYVAVMHPDVAFNLSRDPMWVEINKNAPESLFKNEVGVVGNTRIVTTTRAYKNVGGGSSTAANILYSQKNSGGTAATVYYTLVLSFEAAMTCPLGGSSTPRMIYKDFGSAGTNDPYNQLATIAYTGGLVSKVLDNNRGVIIKTSATITA